MRATLCFESMLNAARLLVTGASGFLGAHLVERSNAAGLHVVAQVHRAGAQSSWLRDLTTIRADFAVLGEVERCLASVKPTCVIHSAALSGLVDCERDLQLAQAVNVHASRALADWCVRNGARLVHVSTDLVFGGTPTPKGGFIVTLSIKGLPTQ